MSHENLSRRNLLKGALLAVAAAPAATLMSREAAAANPLVDPNGNGKALSYVHDASKSSHANFKAGSRCDNCALWVAKPGETRGNCGVFQGYMVEAGGWCAVYTAKRKS